MQGGEVMWGEKMLEKTAWKKCFGSYYGLWIESWCPQLVPYGEGRISSLDVLAWRQKFFGEKTSSGEMGLNGLGEVEAVSDWGTGNCERLGDSDRYMIVESLRGQWPRKNAKSTKKKSRSPR